MATKVPGGVGVRVVDPSKPVFIDNFTVGAGVVEGPVVGQNISVTSSPAKLRLLPAAERGRTYGVPTMHQGAPLNTDDPIALANAAIEF